MKHSILKVMAILIAVLLTAAVVPTAALAAAATNGTAVPPDNYVRRAPKVILPAPGTSILIVTDAETGLPIEGAKYDLYRDNPFNGKDTKVGPTYKTNKDGKITVSHTWTGSFYWVAAGEVEGYAADEAKHEFRIIGLQFATTAVKLGKPAPVEEPAEEEPAIAERPVDEEIAEEPAEPAEAAAPAALGGWTAPEDTAITEEVKTVVDVALEKLLGVDYTPVALVGTQVVAGTNYCVLCEAAAVVPDAVPYYVLVYIYEALDGTVELLTITPLEEGDVIVAEDGTVTLDPVVEIGLPAVEAEEAPAADAAATVTTEETTIG